MTAFGFSEEFVDWELDGLRGWAYHSWAKENEASIWGSNMERRSPGYVKREWNKLMKEYYDKKK